MLYTLDRIFGVGMGEHSIATHLQVDLDKILNGGFVFDNEYGRIHGGFWRPYCSAGEMTMLASYFRIVKLM